jgi:uncharacterized protein YqeY
MLIAKAMKKELYDNDILNLAGRNVLNELKTKFVDVKGEITNEVQFKLLQKMKKDRENMISVYSDAFEKTKSENAKTNLTNAENELIAVNDFLKELEKEMPKKMSEAETKAFIENILATESMNKGMLMKTLKSNANIEMAIAAKIVNQMGIK